MTLKFPKVKYWFMSVVSYCYINCQILNNVGKNDYLIDISEFVIDYFRICYRSNLKTVIHTNVFLTLLTSKGDNTDIHKCFLVKL